MTTRPNILLILTDQERAPTAEEGDVVAAFRAAEMPAHQQLMDRGITFEQHRIASSACTPSRACILTGQSVWVHGVDQTYGFAKKVDDPALNWLRPNALPTIGHHFRAAGYETVYFGKWHLSPADLLEDGRTLRTLGRGGEDISNAIDAYRDANPLDDFGFDGWIGPEPHGASRRNSGTVRDRQFVRQAISWLRARARDSADKPFMMVVSLVNPHDIVFWPSWSLGWQPDGRVPPIPAPASAADGFDNRPRAQEKYRESYRRAYGPAWIIDYLYRRDDDYRRFYYALLARVDRQIQRLLGALDDTGFADRTAMVLTSDHGELLGSHGGLHQKWFNAFDETLRVPLMICSPDLNGRRGTRSQALCSHLDVSRTLLALGGIDPTASALGDGFDKVPSWPGRDLLSSDERDATYYYGCDQIFSGDSPIQAIAQVAPMLRRFGGFDYPPVAGCATAVEAVVARSNGVTHKLVRFFDDAGSRFADEWELYRLDDDPSERRNLAGAANQAETMERMRSLLEEQRIRVGGPKGQVDATSTPLVVRRDPAPAARASMMIFLATMLIAAAALAAAIFIG